MAGIVEPGELPIINLDNLPPTDITNKLVNKRDVDWRTRTIAPLDSPRFIGGMTAPTPPLNDNSDRIATTKFVQQQISLKVPPPSVPNTVDLPTICNPGNVYKFKIFGSKDKFGNAVDYYQIQHGTPLQFNKLSNITENELVSMTVPANLGNVSYSITIVGIKGTKVSVPLNINIQVVNQ